MERASTHSKKSPSDGTETGRTSTSDDVVSRLRFGNDTCECRKPSVGKLRHRGVAFRLGDSSASRSGSLQPKLVVNEPADRYEQEAERVADAVMPMGGPESAASTGDAVSGDRIQRMCPRCRRRAWQGKALDCEECEQELQQKTDASGRGDEAPVQQAAAATRGVGNPLPDQTQSFFEERLGADFRDVRVHTGTGADSAPRGINAPAYTLGSDIVMRSGEYRPTPGRESGCLHTS